MTTRRRLILSSGILTACVCIALAGLAMLPQGAGVTKANFDRIEKGMTIEEVEEILNKHRWTDDDVSLTRRVADWRRDDDGVIARVVFIDGGVADMYWIDYTETFADKLRRRLHFPK